MEEISKCHLFYCIQQQKRRKGKEGKILTSIQHLDYFSVLENQRETRFLTQVFFVPLPRSSIFQPKFIWDTTLFWREGKIDCSILASCPVQHKAWRASYKSFLTMQYSNCLLDIKHLNAVKALSQYRSDF